MVLATPNIGSSIEDAGHAGNPANAMGDPGLLFADTGICADTVSLPGLAAEAEPETKWSGPANVPWRARFTAAGPEAALLEAGWDNKAVRGRCACGSSLVCSCATLRFLPLFGGAASAGGARAAIGRLRARMSLRIRILMPWSMREHKRGVDSGKKNVDGGRVRRNEIG